MLRSTKTSRTGEYSRESEALVQRPQAGNELGVLEEGLWGRWETEPKRAQGACSWDLGQAGPLKPLRGSHVLG